MNLITDRTYLDVLSRTEKGNYGPDDLNRVESAVAQLIVLAKAAGVDINLVVKADWDYPEVFSADSWSTYGQMMRYLGNVNELCNALDVSARLPEKMEFLDYIGANQIEKALLLTYERVKSILQLFQYSGEVYAGEESGL